MDQNRNNFNKIIYLCRVLFCLLFVFYGQIASALTPAGTIIRNHAIVQFQRDDESGRVYEAPSNEVLIEVLPVYGLEITPDGNAPPDIPGPGQTQRTVSAMPNTQVTFNYSLVFTGNISDNAIISPVFEHEASNFLPKLPDGDTGFMVYNDLDRNGIVDGNDILVASWRDANANGQLDASEIQASDLGRRYDVGDVISLLVTFRVPAGLAPGAVTYFGIEGASMGNPNMTDPVDDQAIKNISELTIINDAIMTVTKGVDHTTTVPGADLYFNVIGTSVGSSAAKQITITVDENSNSHSGIIVYDVIPKVEGSNAALPVSSANIISQPIGIFGTLIYSAQGNTNLPITDLSWAWHTTYQSGDTVIAYISSNGSGSDFDLAPSQSIEFAFTCAIPTSVNEQLLTNKAYATYDTENLGVQTVKAINDVNVQVRGMCGVLIRDTDFEAVKPPLTPDTHNDHTDDLQTVALAQAGSYVYFTNRVINTGSFVNSFNISIDHTLSNNPNNWTYSFFKSDGVTPLRDTGTDGIIDTGPMSPAGDDWDNPLDYRDIVIRVEIPENAEPNGNDPELKLVIQAASVVNDQVTDNTTNIIQSCQKAEMDLNNHNPVGTGTASPDPWEQTGTAGEYVLFPLIVKNLAPEGGDVDTYTLTTPILPPGWKVEYFRDLNKDGILSADELLPVLRSAAIEPQAEDFLIARVHIPAGALTDADKDGVQDVYSLTFRASSTNLPGLYADQEDTVILTWQDDFEITANRQGTIEANGVTIYPHIVKNFSERALRIFLTINPGTEGWNYSLLTEDGSAELPKAIDPLDSEEKYYIDLGEFDSANNSAALQIRLYAPGAVPQGTMDITTILATANIPGSTPLEALETKPLHFVTDITRVVAGDLLLTKKASLADGAVVQPGQNITYTTTFFNKGTATLADLAIQDQIPNATAYVLRSAEVATPLPEGITAVNYEISRDGGVTWTQDTLGSGADKTVTNVRAVFQGALKGGEEGSMSFDVQVK